MQNIGRECFAYTHDHLSEIAKLIDFVCFQEIVSITT